MACIYTLDKTVASQFMYSIIYLSFQQQFKDWTTNNLMLYTGQSVLWTKEPWSLLPINEINSLWNWLKAAAMAKQLLCKKTCTRKPLLGNINANWSVTCFVCNQRSFIKVWDNIVIINEDYQAKAKTNSYSHPDKRNTVQYALH